MAHPHGTSEGAAMSAGLIAGTAIAVLLVLLGGVFIARPLLRDSSPGPAPVTTQPAAARRARGRRVVPLPGRYPHLGGASQHPGADRCSAALAEANAALAAWPGDREHRAVKVSLGVAVAGFTLGPGTVAVAARHTMASAAVADLGPALVTTSVRAAGDTAPRQVQRGAQK
jgi:hypothetical protein